MNIFKNVKLQRPGSSRFDLTHDVKMSCEMGKLVPCCLMETVPGDRFQISSEALVRFAPMISPVMHRIDVSIHYWYVPRRIVNPMWDEWIFNQDSTVIHPYLDLDRAMWDANRLFDYMGIPRPGASQVVRIDPTSFAAYQFIYNENYRDQNLIPEVNFMLQPGANIDTDLFQMRLRSWEHDYYTSALPFAQKGDNIAIPLGDVVLKDLSSGGYDQLTKSGQGTSLTNVPGIGSNAQGELQSTGTLNPVVIDPNGTMEIEATSVTDLRRALKLQEWLERNARAGTRYFEGLLSHFGIRTADARINIPEYITGVKSAIQISEVLNTAGVVAENQLPQGNMAGHGIGVAKGRFGGFKCPEHGHIIGILSVMPKSAYADGLPAHFSKFDDQFKHYWPTFQNIGEQEIKNKEVYLDSTAPEGTFGYMPRYAEYKSIPSRLAGDMRTTLAHWHLSRQFSSEPALNQAFVECVPSKRIFAVQDGTDELIIHCLNKVQAVRPMQYYGSPGM